MIANLGPEAGSSAVVTRCPNVDFKRSRAAAARSRSVFGAAMVEFWRKKDCFEMERSRDRVDLKILTRAEDILWSMKGMSHLFLIDSVAFRMKQ